MATVRVKAGLDGKALVKALSDPAVASSKVLHFDTLEGFDFPRVSLIGGDGGDGRGEGAVVLLRAAGAACTRVPASRCGCGGSQAFKDDAVASRFAERMKLYGSIWCCVLAHPGEREGGWGQ